MGTVQIGEVKKGKGQSKSTRAIEWIDIAGVDRYSPKGCTGSGMKKALQVARKESHPFMSNSLHW